MSVKFIDQLSWKNFFNESKKEKHIAKVKPFNRLIAHSKNYFLIGGYGAFTPGYLILITKGFIPSFGLIKDENLEELNFIIKLLKENISENLDRKNVIFEHGMCACVGGLDRAHLHIMSINKLSTEETLLNAINKTLYDRKAGIKYIEFKNYKLENIHDINHFIETNKGKKDLEFKIAGEILNINDIKNLTEQKWPKITLPHITKGGHYVFFRSDYNNASFLTTNNFQTQFGRQAVFENEIKIDNSFKITVKKIKKNNEFLDIWKWQNCKFESNILDTVNSTRLYLKGFKIRYQMEYDKFEFKII